MTWPDEPTSVPTPLRPSPARAPPQTGGGRRTEIQGSPPGDPATQPRAAPGPLSGSAWGPFVGSFQRNLLPPAGPLPFQLLGVSVLPRHGLTAAPPGLLCPQGSQARILRGLLWPFFGAFPMRIEPRLLRTGLSSAWRSPGRC